MKIIAKFLLIYCIIAVIGHDVMTQDDPPKDEFNIGEFNRWYRESQEKYFLERQRSMRVWREWWIANVKASEDNNNQLTDTTAQNGFSEDELREFNRIWKEAEKKDFLERQRRTQMARDNTKDPHDLIVQYRYTICMNRPGKYKLGEPIFIRNHVKNLSDYWVHIYKDPSRSLFSTDRISLVNADGSEVPMTRSGRQENENVRSDKTNAVFRGEKISHYLLLPQKWSPLNEKELKPSPIVLNHYFDLTRPGVYHLTFHRLSLEKDEQLDKPLISNTLTFEVLDEFVTPDDLRDPGEFIWPPPDEKEPDAVIPPAE